MIVTAPGQDPYPIDVSLVERIRYESDVTEEAVEEGADVADNIRAKQPVLEFDGVVSDTPTGAIAQDPTRQGVTNVARDAFDRFVAIHGARKPVIVECSYGKFDTMTLTSLVSEKDKESSKAFKFTATFKRIRINRNNRKTVRFARQKLGDLGTPPNVSLIPGGIPTYVLTFPIAKRAAMSKSYGAPVLTDQTVIIGEKGTRTTVSAFDCYELPQSRWKNADGYLTNNRGTVIYHQFISLYDPATGGRRDAEGNDVTQSIAQMPAQNTGGALSRHKGPWWSQYRQPPKPSK